MDILKYINTRPHVAMSYLSLMHLVLARPEEWLNKYILSLIAAFKVFGLPDYPHIS